MAISFEHVGMTCGDLDRTIAFYCDLLGLTLALRKTNERGELAFLDTGSGMLEIACPIADIARSRDVPPHEAGMRHLTFAVDSVDTMIEQLEAAGVTIVEPPRNAINTELIRRLAFVRDPDGILVELIERAAGR
ncbi:MAG: VOC family protein [Devosia sp.]|jgi:glyoxylase I family protein